MARRAPTPVLCAASMYGICRIASALARTTRVARGSMGTMMAAMTWTVPAPRAATTAMARMTSGKDSRTSITRCANRSTLPPT